LAYILNISQFIPAKITHCILHKHCNGKR